MWPEQPETQELLSQARAGRPEAVERLLTAHREPLRRMIGLRLDPALAARVDGSVDAPPARGAPAARRAAAGGRRRSGVGRRGEALMSALPSTTDGRDETLAALLSELAEQRRQGRRPDVEAVAVGHPELAAEL